MYAHEILRKIESAGGQLWLAGEAVSYRLPESMLPLLDELRRMKPELAELLRQRPAMPGGVRLVHWRPIAAPVKINRWLTVTHTERFIETTLGQIAAKLIGDHWKSGYWSMSELLERLEQVGVFVELVEGFRWRQ